MVTYKTLEVFLSKCTDSLEAVEKEISSERKQLRYLEDSKVAIQAQIDTLKQLMDAENNPQKIEIPVAGEGNIEELFNERLGKAEFPDAVEMRKQRQEGVYKREALGIVEQIDEANNESNTSENSSTDPA